MTETILIHLIDGGLIAASVIFITTCIYLGSTVRERHAHAQAIAESQAVALNDRNAALTKERDWLRAELTAMRPERAGSYRERAT